MPDRPRTTQPPAVFRAAVESVNAAKTRAELSIGTIPSPTGLAPWSIALAADVVPALHGSDSELGTGRFILLHDPDEPEAWGGAFRVVCFAGAPLEAEIGIDPFLADVAWSWLVEALSLRDAEYEFISGTATKTISTGFGEIASQVDGAQIELRASWTPTDRNFSAHVEAWSELLCMLAGLPPAEGVSLMSSHRVGRG